MPRRLLISGVKRSSKKSDKYFFNIQLIFISLIYIKCILRAEKVFCIWISENEGGNQHGYYGTGN